MNRVFCIIIVAVVALTSCSVSKSRTDKVSGREDLTRNDSINREIAILAINNNSWMLKADRVIPKGKSPIYLQSNANFLQVVGDKVTLQTSTGFGGGVNGMGGVTLRGTIKNEGLESGKRGDLIYSYSVAGVRFNGIITLNIGKVGVMAEAYFNINSGDSFTLRGEVVPYSAKRILEGAY